jgi:redox-sensitive bicupin YhaK (pirin superfamily)
MSLSHGTLRLIARWGPQHGPFVMSSQEQIVRCFKDYQSGALMPKKATMTQYT